MKNSSLGKRAVAGACALTLALSMPALAFGTGEQEPVTDQQALAQAVADEAASNTVFNDATNTATTTINPDDSGLSVQPSADPDAPVTDDLEVTVEYDVSDEITTQEELDAAIEENGPIIEQVTAPSEAFEAIKNDPTKVDGSEADKAAAAELISSPDNYISANTFKVNAVEQGDDTTVTVVYAPDANAESVECYVYYTVVKGGQTINKVEKLTLTDGKYTLELDGSSAEITFVLANSDTSIATAGATTNKSNGGDAENGYELVYTTGTTQAMLGNGGLNWSASASADIHQATEAGNAGNLAISATEGDAAASPAYTASQHNARFDYAKVINLTVTSAADADDITNAKISANVGAANRTVRVFWDEVIDGKPAGKYRDLVSDANGNITVEGIAPGTIYTLAVAPAGQAPTDPSDPNIPVIPDQPVDPDQPIIPDTPGTDTGVPGADADADNDATKGGAAASDKGATSPKTGIFA